MGSCAAPSAKGDDKFITTDYLQQCLVDNVTVETGSFNFTKAAETKNSENAVVIWNMPKLAESFLEHWQDRWNQGRDYRSSY